MGIPGEKHIKGKLMLSIQRCHPLAFRLSSKLCQELGPLPHNQRYLGCLSHCCFRSALHFHDLRLVS